MKQLNELFNFTKNKNVGERCKEIGLLAKAQNNMVRPHEIDRIKLCELPQMESEKIQANSTAGTSLVTQLESFPDSLIKDFQKVKERSNIQINYFDRVESIREGEDSDLSRITPIN